MADLILTIIGISSGVIFGIAVASSHYTGIIKNLSWRLDSTLQNLTDQGNRIERIKFNKNGIHGNVKPGDTVYYIDDSDEAYPIKERVFQKAEFTLDYVGLKCKIYFEDSRQVKEFLLEKELFQERVYDHGRYMYRRTSERWKEDESYKEYEKVWEESWDCEESTEDLGDNQYLQTIMWDECKKFIYSSVEDAKVGRMEMIHNEFDKTLIKFEQKIKLIDNE